MSGFALLSVVALVQAEPKKGAYLGVSTTPVDPAVADHLDLAAGVGLAVQYIDPDGAVADKLKSNDILQKFNDQILISQRQLAILVRAQKPGDEARLTFIRKGKTQEITAKLVEKELSELSKLSGPHPRVQIQPPALQPFKIHRFGPKGGVQVLPFDGSFDEIGEKIRKRMEEHFKGMPQLDLNIDELNRKLQEEIRKVRPFGNPGDDKNRSQSFSRSSSVSKVTMADGDLSVTLTTKDGDQHLLAKRTNGDILFDGSVNTEEETAKGRSVL